MVDLKAIQRFHQRFHTAPQLEIGLVRGDAATRWGVLRQLAREIATRREGIRQRLVQAENSRVEAQEVDQAVRPVRMAALRQAEGEQIDAARQLAAEMVALAQVADHLAQEFDGVDVAEAARLDALEHASRLVLRAAVDVRLIGKPSVEVAREAMRVPGEAGRELFETIADPDRLESAARSLRDGLDKLPELSMPDRFPVELALRSEADALGASALLGPADTDEPEGAA